MYHMFIYIYILYIFELSRCTCVLADLSDVLLFAVLRDYEASNIGMFNNLQLFCL